MSRFSKFWLNTHYPTTIIRDRYNGTYSGAKWLAFPLDFYQVPGEVDGGDTECMMFWGTYNDPVGKGATPKDAIEDLTKQFKRDLYGHNG